MARVLAVGIATLDVINSVSQYPTEDAEVRATAQRVCRGGNATNTLVVLSQLGHHCAWAGTLAQEPDAEHIKADLRHYDIDMSAVKQVAQGKVPTSYVTLSQATASRTIVHFRDLPEYDDESFAQLDLQSYDWIHFEGRNVNATERMLMRVRRDARSVKISLEVEKPRENIERLCSYADVLMISRHYCLARSLTQPEAVSDFFHTLNPRARFFLAWGEAGGYAWEHSGEIVHVPAKLLPHVVDTLGAGDTFNAGVIDSLLRGLNIPDTLLSAVELAGIKCGQMGLANLR